MKNHLIHCPAILASALLLGGCSMFRNDYDEDPISTQAPAKPTTVPAIENDTSTPSGLARELFISFPRRVSDFFSGKTATNAAVAMESRSPDQRREGINDLVDRTYGKQAPYTDRYAQIARFDNDASVRATAMRALNRSREGAIDVFIEGLSDDSPLVRLEAAKALSNVPSEKAIQPLLKVSNSASETTDIRIAATDALRHYRSLEVARSLVNDLNDRDFSIAWQARQSLRFMTGADKHYDQSAWLKLLTDEKPLG